jgi:hypothetical protein
MGRRIVLSREQMYEIKENKDKLSNKQLVAKYGVSIGTILNVKAGRGVYAENSTARQEN